MSNTEVLTNASAFLLIQYFLYRHFSCKNTKTCAFFHVAVTKWSIIVDKIIINKSSDKTEFHSHFSGLSDWVRKHSNVFTLLDVINVDMASSWSSGLGISLLSHCLQYQKSKHIKCSGFVAFKCFITMGTGISFYVNKFEECFRAIQGSPE